MDDNIEPGGGQAGGEGIGFSPAGNRFWLLAGEESDEEDGDSSDPSR